MPPAKAKAVAKGGKGKGKGDLKPVEEMTKPEKAKAWGWLKTNIKYAPKELQTAYEKANVAGSRDTIALNNILKTYIEGNIAKVNGDIASEWEHADFKTYVQKQSITEKGATGMLVTPGRLETFLGAKEAERAIKENWYEREWDSDKKIWMYWFDEKHTKQAEVTITGHEASGSSELKSQEALEKAQASLLFPDAKTEGAQEEPASAKPEAAKVPDPPKPAPEAPENTPKAAEVPEAKPEAPAVDPPKVVAAPSQSPSPTPSSSAPKKTRKRKATIELPDTAKTEVASEDTHMDGSTFKGWGTLKLTPRDTHTHTHL